MIKEALNAVRAYFNTVYWFEIKKKVKSNPELLQIVDIYEHHKITNENLKFANVYLYLITNIKKCFKRYNENQIDGYETEIVKENMMIPDHIKILKNQ